MTHRADIRPEDQSEKAESFRDNLWKEIQLKGPYKQKQTQEQNKNSGQARLVYVWDVNHNISTTRRWASWDSWYRKYISFKENNLKYLFLRRTSCPIRGVVISFVNGIIFFPVIWCQPSCGKWFIWNLDGLDHPLGAKLRGYCSDGQRDRRSSSSSTSSSVL